MAVLGGEDDPSGRALLQALAWSHLDRWGRQNPCCSWAPGAAVGHHAGSRGRGALLTACTRPQHGALAPLLPASCSWAH